MLPINMASIKSTDLSPEHLTNGRITVDFVRNTTNNAAVSIDLNKGQMTYRDNNMESNHFFGTDKATVSLLSPYTTGLTMDANSEFHEARHDGGWTFHAVDVVKHTDWATPFAYSVTFIVNNTGHVPRSRWDY